MTIMLANFKKRFCVDWTSLLVGWRGFGCFSHLVTLSEVKQFALDKLEDASNLNPDLVELATASEVEADDVGVHLANLASGDNTDYDTAVRKWIVCLLDEKLDELPSDPLYGLLGLTEFWSDVGFPEYSPHEIQGKDNEISPQDYYTEDNYIRMLERHRQWIEKETHELKLKS